ncbi:MAG: 4'-phosphopantetheinyl transferase family protein [Trebonia sp.]
MTGPPSAAEVDIWSVRLGGPPPDGAWAALSDAERDRARRMRSPAGRRDFVRSHYATREILARYTAMAPAALEFRLGARGKPRAAGPVEFSLSHTDGLALIAVSAADVGVDVELIRAAPLADGLIARCLTAAERAAVAGADDPTTAFLRYWTAKESYLKGLGIGLAEPLENLEVRWDGQAGRIARSGEQDRRWRLRALAVGPHHLAAVSVLAPGPGTALPVRYREWPGELPRPSFRTDSACSGCGNGLPGRVGRFRSGSRFSSVFLETAMVKMRACLYPGPSREVPAGSVAGGRQVVEYPAPCVGRDSPGP